MTTTKAHEKAEARRLFLAMNEMFDGVDLGVIWSAISVMLATTIEESFDTEEEIDDFLAQLCRRIKGAPDQKIFTPKP
jgi:hypothetical protein